MRSVLVTGAAGGLGSATVRRLAAAGWDVFAADLDAPALHQLASERVVPLVVDVTDEASVDAMAAHVSERTGRLDAVVNFAGVLGIGPLVEIDPSYFRRVLDVNVVGGFLVNRALFPLLVAAKGRVVLMSSETGWQTAMPFNGPYAMSKHAVEAYGDALRREVAMLDVDVVKIRPARSRPAWSRGSRRASTTWRRARPITAECCNSRSGPPRPRCFRSGVGCSRTWPSMGAAMCM